MQNSSAPAQHSSSHESVCVVDQIGFVFGVLNTYFVAYLMGGRQYLLPIVYTIKAPILIGMRFFIYKANKWHYFLLDFCYFGNFLLLVYLWGAPSQPYLFLVAFSVMNGPIAWAVIIFNNSLVFHSLDKVTSVFIHVTPPFVTFCIRWYIESMHASAPYGSNYSICIDDECSAPFLWLVLVPWGYFLAHQIGYFIFVQLLPHKKLREDKEILTSYRYLTSKKNTHLFKVVNCFGKKGRVYMFGVVNSIYAFLTILPNMIWYQWFGAHIAFLCILVVIITWNGASFYFSVFKRETKSKPKIKPLAESVGLAIQN
eukprot:GILK01002964.1.p1 GENE.GILK01002964.1~~GILK01002964.1.p1  ORF type:complete len:363 (+),score=35.36 GILK01002964.1:152-1090(+)